MSLFSRRKKSIRIRKSIFPASFPDAPVEYTTYRLEAYVPAKDLANALNVRERDIAQHNQAVQATVWQGSKHLPRNLEIRMPVEMVDGSLADAVARLSADALFDEQLPDLFHRVARGDTLSQIADTYNTRVSTLVALNGLSSSNRIRAGQQIRLPAAGPAPAQPPVAVAQWRHRLHRLQCWPMRLPSMPLAR